MMFISLEKLKNYFWSLFGAVGIIAFWAGVWEGIGGLPYLEMAWVSFLVGLVMLSLSGMIYKQFDVVEGVEKAVNNVLHKVHIHPRKEEFHVGYRDKIMKKDILLKADKLKRIEKGFLVFVERGEKELFVPVHRINKVLHRGKIHWKL